MSRHGGDGERRPRVRQPVVRLPPLLPVELLDPLPGEDRRDALDQHHLVAVGVERQLGKLLPPGKRKFRS